MVSRCVTSCTLCVTSSRLSAWPFVCLDVPTGVAHMLLTMIVCATFDGAKMNNSGLHHMVLSFAIKEQRQSKLPKGHVGMHTALLYAGTTDDS